MSKMKKLILKCEVEIAQRKHLCKHNKNHIISKGDKRLTLVLNDGRATKINYCKECGLKMLNQSICDLETLKSELTK